MMNQEPSKPIRVLRILNRFNVGGPIWNVAFLTKYLPESYETLLIGGKATESEADAQEILNKLAISFRIIPSLSREINLYNDCKSLIAILRIIREYKPHIIHTHASKAGFLGRLAASIAGVPILVHTYHGHVFEGYFSRRKSSFIQRVERFLARKTTAIVAISVTQKTELTEKYRICSTEKTHIVPLGFDLRPFNPSAEKRRVARENYGLNSNTVAVGIVGRLTAIKNHDLFLEAAAILVKNSSVDYQFYIVGDGERREELQAKVGEMGLLLRVQFTSWIYEMETFYPAIDLICLTSLNEGTPVSLIEAQSAGIPVISTKVGGVENTMKEGVTGLLLESFNAKELANKIEGLAIDVGLRNQMSKNALTFATEHFSYQRLVADVEQLYEKLLKNA